MRGDLLLNLNNLLGATYFFHGATAPTVPGPTHYRGLTITHTQAHHTR